MCFVNSSPTYFTENHLGHEDSLKSNLGYASQKNEIKISELHTVYLSAKLGSSLYNSTCEL